MAGAVPGGRGQPPGRGAGHAGRPVPLRLLRPETVRRLAEHHHLLHLRLEDEQGDLLRAAVPGAQAPRDRAGPGGAVRQVPEAGPAGAGEGVQEVPGDGDQRSPRPGPQHPGASDERPRVEPPDRAALQRPQGRAQLAPQVQAGPGEGEHPGAAEQEAERQVQAAAGAEQQAEPGRELRVQRHGADLRQLAQRHDAGAERASLAPEELPAPALRGPGPAPHGAAAEAPALRQPLLRPGPGQVRAEHDARPRLLLGQALPHIVPGRQGGHLRVAGAAERGADQPGGGILQRGHEAPRLRAEQDGEGHMMGTAPGEQVWLLSVNLCTGSVQQCTVAPSPLTSICLTN